MLYKTIVDVNWNSRTNSSGNYKTKHMESDVMEQVQHSNCSYKIFCDAAWKDKDSDAGVGIYITDEFGKQTTSNCFRKRAYSPLSAEMWAIWHGLQKYIWYLSSQLKVNEWLHVKREFNLNAHLLAKKAISNQPDSSGSANALSNLYDDEAAVENLNYQNSKAIQKGIENNASSGVIKPVANTVNTNSSVEDMSKRGMTLMHRYELGRLLGKGAFAKVYHARSIATGQNVAIKVIDKEKVLRVGMIEQIKREISIMRRIRHPNIVQLYEVMANKNKIYFVMEYVKGGELFKKVAKGGLKEDAARKYFQQLIEAIDFCHSRGVYHRDLKPENLLIDENGILKVSDFGLSAFKESQRQDGLLHTLCGTPAYVAPEIINKKGYDGTKADLWSCGVILFVLLAGYLPFHDSNLIEMYRKITRGDFKCPNRIPSDVRKLITRLLDPNPKTRITVEMLVENPWFKKGLKPVEAQNQSEKLATLKDVISSFSIKHNNEESHKKTQMSEPVKPTSLNAFDIIALSPGFDLSGLFERESPKKQEDRFTTQKSASAIVSKLEEIAEMEHFKVMKKDGVVKLEGRKEGRKGLLAIDAEIFEVTPAFHVVEVKKSSGDTMEYQRFCNQDLKPFLKDIIWTWEGADHCQLPPLPPVPQSNLMPGHITET
ncbi:CBL-interacting protein kinase 5-like [Canna indica]|uniref:non-specific serine/threonine protein kinase n=1 Tax=Canna indica TaxID=4628 RepID=A0AAQ3KHM6_9LILI|nr:CBL-interacting protein kinase 5-like [Canna indica]